jgi:uncharacterized RDD family membrane protein YckC
MDKDPASSSDKPKLPPPSLSKAPPPPAPRVTPPPSPPKDQPSAPPLQVGVAKGSTENDADTEHRPEPDAPGSDASMPNRVIGAVIDSVVALGLWWTAIFILPGFLHFLAMGVMLAYLLLRDAIPFLEGQSIGKKAMGIRAVTRDGKSLAGDWQASLIRNAVFAIPLFPLVELYILNSRQENPKPLLRLGDEWAKTKVINGAPPKAAVEDNVVEKDEAFPMRGDENGEKEA